MEMGINEFVQWVLGSGGAVIVGSWIVERIPQFQLLSPEKKEYFFFAFTSVIWVAFYLILNYVPQAFIDAASPYFMGISGLFVVVVLGKLFHKADKIDQA